MLPLPFSAAMYMGDRPSRDNRLGLAPALSSSRTDHSS
jgi:hypothetical protein